MEIATEDTRMYTFANERPTDRKTDRLFNGNLLAFPVFGGSWQYFFLTLT